MTSIASSTTRVDNGQNDVQNTSLRYKIAGCSSVSASYVPENILVDAPKDISSRWNGHNHAGAKSTRQWILLELDPPNVIVRSITFGKYFKPHPCNAKDLLVLAGAREDSLVEVLRVSLRNDPTYETFPLRSTTGEGFSFPSRYIKIITLSAHNKGFNTSLWFVSLQGDPAVNPAVAKYREHQEFLTTKLILKHLRQRGLHEAFDTLLRTSTTQLEHPLVTELHDSLVTDGDVYGAEDVLLRSFRSGLLDQALRLEGPRPDWTFLRHSTADGDAPSKRYGHQMCLDPVDRAIYLFAGVNKRSSYSDLWKYNIATSRWSLLSRDTSRDGGPRIGDFHQMVLHPRSGKLFVLSCKGEKPLPPPHPESPRHSQLHAISVRAADQGWECISSDTASEGGPSPAFGQQMVIDSQTDSLWIFGGKVLENTGADKYSGMWQYSIESKKWTSIFTDPPKDVTVTTIQPHILSRTGHAMILDPKTRQIYIFGGKRHSDLLSDTYIFHCDSHEITQVAVDHKMKSPEAFHQATAILDSRKRHIYLQAPYAKGSSSEGKTLGLTLWVFSLEEQCWTQAAPARERLREEGQAEEWRPIPRYSHSVCYDELFGTMYMFGGDSGTEEALDDLWAMKLHWIAGEQILRQLRFAIRRVKFVEMAEELEPLEALTYLSTEVSAVVDHEDAAESDDYRSLMSHLMQQLQPDDSGSALDGRKSLEGRGHEAQHLRRLALFDKILQYFPPDSKQPKLDLLDLIPAI